MNAISSLQNRPSCHRHAKKRLKERFKERFKERLMAGPFKRLMAGPFLLSAALLGNFSETARAEGSAAGAEAKTNRTSEKSQQSGNSAWNLPVPPASWRIAFKYASPISPEAAPFRPSSVSVTVIGDRSLEVIEYPDRKTEVWKVGSVALLSAPESNEATFRPSSFNNVATDPSTTVTNVKRARDGTVTGMVNGALTTLGSEDPDWMELTEFDWIRPEMLKGKVEIAGEILFIYADIPAETPAGLNKPGASPAPLHPRGPLGGIPLKPGVRVAAILEGNRLPRYLQNGPDISVYSFSTPSQAALELPPKVASQITKPAVASKGVKVGLFVP